jgi:hypothetical protein
LSVGEVSRGLFSSRIDLDLDSRLNALGLLFLTELTFEEEGVPASLAESMETSDFDGPPPTGFLLVDLSALRSD